MEFFSAEFWLSLLAIIMIDLVLAGDNAIVIGMVAGNLPVFQQKKVIVWGTAGAIAVRIVATMAVMWLLMIPGLKLLGGLLLIWIAYKLLAGKKGHGPLNPVGSMWKAMGTIIVADTAMGLDNVLAIAGAAHGHLLLIVIGLIISIPIMVYGSTLVIKLIKRFPVALYIGAGVLAWTAGSMIAEEPLLGIAEIPLLKWGVTAFVTVASLAAGKLRNHMRQRSLPHIAAEKGGSHHG